MKYEFSAETIQRVARKQYELNHEASMNQSNIIHIDNNESRLQAVKTLIASKLCNYPQDTIEEAMKYGEYRLSEGDTAYRAIYKTIQLTRRLVDLPGPTAA